MSGHGAKPIDAREYKGNTIGLWERNPSLVAKDGLKYAISIGNEFVAKIDKLTAASDWWRSKEMDYLLRVKSA